jgi:AcrR family transcriptional regulator
MGIIERKEREKQGLKMLILETATQMFLEDGFEKTSLRKIAEKIEYSPATIYLHYKDKDELFFDVHEKGFGLLFEKMQLLFEIKNPLERLHHMGEVYLSFAFENPGFYDLMFIMQAPMEWLSKKNEIEWNCGKKNFNMLHQTVVECMELRLIKSDDANVTSMSIFSFVHGMVSLAIRDRFMMYEKSTLPQLFKKSIQSMLHLMTA